MSADLYVTLFRSEAQDGGGDDTLKTIGPFEYVQLTYEGLRCDENGPVFFLSDDTGFWHPEKRTPVGPGPWVGCEADTSQIGYTDFTVSTQAPEAV